MCFETAGRLMRKFSATPFNVIRCLASRVNIARRLESAIAWKTSRLMVSYM
jgi:hypothetical protein